MEGPFQKASLFSSWGHAAAFWGGSLAVTIGVLLHVPMFWMGRKMGFRLAGMPMDPGMLAGMALIIGGFAAASYGLLPKRRRGAPVPVYEELPPPEDAPLTRAHWGQIALLTVALVIDVMKAATLGFVTPGMRGEYAITAAAVSRLPFVALIGTAAGSFLWGALADIYGRRASILLAAVMFMGTSICGAMPSFTWNIIMCFLMGVGAGGMLPVAYALLAEIMPTKHRGWCLVLVGGAGAIGGYFATSGLSSLLQPFFGWRIMWLINLPTALVLIAVSPLLQESARFLEKAGRIDEARATLARFGVSFAATPSEAEQSQPRPAPGPLTIRDLFGTTFALTLAALAWGFVNFGVMLWLPGSLVAEGRSMGLASGIIAQSTAIAAPGMLLAAYLYSVWSAKRVLVLAIGITTLGLLAVLARSTGAFPILANPVMPLTLLIVGTAAVISILLPYAAESYPLRVRGRATGWVAGCSKTGGLAAQGLGALGLVPTIGVAAGVIAIPAVISMLLIAALSRDTRGRDLRELETVRERVPQVD